MPAAKKGTTIKVKVKGRPPRAALKPLNAADEEFRKLNHTVSFNSLDDLILQKPHQVTKENHVSNKAGKRVQCGNSSEVETTAGKARAKKPRHQSSLTPLSDEAMSSEHLKPMNIGGGSQCDGNHHPRPATAELSQKVSRLLSQEPASGPVGLTYQPYNLKLDLAPPEHQIVAVKDKEIAILEEKLKRLQKDVTQLRDANEAKDKLFDEYRQVRETEAEVQLKRYKAQVDVTLAAKAKITALQEAELTKSHRAVSDLHLKLTSISNGEADRIRERLEDEKQDLLRTNEELRSNYDTQRRRRKDVERELKHARSAAREEVQDRLKELETEQETLRKELAAETENSKNLIAQLNQVRSVNGQSGRVGGPTTGHASTNVSTSRATSSNGDLVDELKARLAIIGDFTGFTILGGGKDAKGKMYDCIVTDLKGRGYAISFKLQFHTDGTCSFDPFLDEKRDAKTMAILPDSFKHYIRFDEDAGAFFYRTLFEAFNSSSTS
ncbi:uncharacterized protein MELLADRAFT_67584 [Melampsora larici-populina 98AG31]|uniref:Monopolin complex subunit Csm1/Pcs1 C-terminal domain-containing protein n=1 Tax=Melampsora larici-populina (strain 98AG31 / pathotype 3-4-7) TaxID=747676 RepID=F4S3N8_MELLP|nr:uncharacterized protein MELLADRAFT_67584 [Melampsora larici-populina 98AG31]EGG00762.1 hypothetical protein MELLADRAFT_67584 [Melampsora larici-populina 98AG31]